MRFLCDNCKAKYQIADEKVEGRAVRMKCRKCGHVIDIRPPTAAQREPSGVHPVPVPAPAPATAPTPAASTAAAPRPAAAAPRPVRTAPSTSGQAGGVPRPAAQTLASAAAPTSGALAGAFHRSVQEPVEADVSAAIEVLSAGAAEEWYVGVNGVPIGPVRLSDLRQKAAQGLINEESLVWREGFEEWLPLRTFPELVVLVHEARESSSRSSLMPGALPGLKRPSNRVPAAPAPKPAPTPKPAVSVPAPSSEGAVLFGSLPAPAESPAASSLFPQDEAPTLARMAPSTTAAQAEADPFAPPPAVTSPLGLGFPAPTAAMSQTPAPVFSQPPSEGPSQAPHMPSDMLPKAPMPTEAAVINAGRSGHMHPALYVLLAVAAGFGATLAYVFFTNSKTTAASTNPVTSVVVQAPTVPTTLDDHPIPAPVERAAGGSTEPVNVAANDPQGGRHAGGGETTGGKVGSAAADSKGGSPGGGPKFGLGDGPVGGGPTVGSTNEAESSSQSQLEQNEIERVVSAQRPSVKRGCWEPALASRDPNAPKSAKVTVSVVIGADGRVRSASAAGGDKHPGLASCITSRVRNWSFPRSGGETRVNIPFAFFAQQ